MNPNNETQQNYGQQSQYYNQQPNYLQQQYYQQQTQQTHQQQNIQQQNYTQYQQQNIQQQNYTQYQQQNTQQQGYNPYQQQNISQPQYYNQIPPQQYINPPVKPKKSKTKLIIIISIIVAVLLATGALTIKFTFYSSNNVEDRAFDSSDQAINTFFKALNNRDKDLLLSCLPDLTTSGEKQQVDTLLNEFIRLDVNIDLNSIEKDAWSARNRDANDNDVGYVNGTIIITQIINANTSAKGKVKESFKLKIVKLRKNNTYIITGWEFDSANAQIIEY